MLVNRHPAGTATEQAGEGNAAGLLQLQTALVTEEPASPTHHAAYWQAALQRASGLLVREPLVALHWCLQGECLLHLGRFDQALACFQRAEAIGGPGTEEVGLWQSLCLHQAGNTKIARARLAALLYDMHMPLATQRQARMLLDLLSATPKDTQVGSSAKSAPVQKKPRTEKDDLVSSR